MQDSSYKPHMNLHQFHPQIPPLHHPYNPHHPPQLQPSIINHHHYYSDYERKLIDEVIYLHSLWRRGPPSSSSNPHLKPSPSTSFKKKKKPTTLVQVSDKEWPVEPKPTSQLTSGSGWPEFKPQDNPISRPATAQERASVLGVKIQLKGVESCSQLFRRRSEVDDDDDDDDDDDVEEEEDEDDDDDDVEEEEVEFFMKVFQEDAELKGYYEKNCENGEFYCLVCGVIGNKLGRKYKNCIALVQHSVSISKTKKRKAHRAYGNVICKVLGWDINQLPSLQSALGDANASGQFLEKSCEVQGEVENHATGSKHDPADVEREGNKADIATGSSQAELKNIPDTVETNVSSADAGCIASELTQSEVEVENHADGCKRNSADLQRDGDKVDIATASSQAEPKDIPCAVEANVSSVDAGCIASKLTQSESERNGNADVSEVGDCDGFKNDGVRSRSENVQSQQENAPGSVQVEAVSEIEGCSALGSKSVDNGMIDDAYQELEILPKEFQIPE